MIKVKEYENGLKLIVKDMPGVLSVSAGILVGAGSCLEDDNTNGISHFIEHVNFKGTEKYSSFELSEKFDEIGSQVNAYTSKEMTCYYVKSTVTASEKSFELLSDLFLNSVYDKEELEKEKGVITEEINMSSDIPEEVCMDNLSAAYFGNEGLGRTILGPQKNVLSFTKEDILKYRKRFYNADNIVLSFAGKIDFEKATYFAEKYFVPFVSSIKSEEKKQIPTDNLCQKIFYDKDIEQTHIAFGYKGIEYDGIGSDEFSLINIVLGSGMSSRLFQEVREKRGLCYTVYSYPSGYKDTGTLAVYAGVNPDSAKEAKTCVEEVVKSINGGITQKEFERGKAQVLSSFIFGEESAAAQMMLYGRYLLMTGKVFDTEGKLKAIENMTIESVNDAARSFDSENYAFSAVAKDCSKIKD